MDESQCQGEGQRVEFEFMMADARNMRGACVLLGEYGGDVSKLKEAESWLFGGTAPRQGGKTGLFNTGGSIRRGQNDKAVARNRGHRGREIANSQQHHPTRTTRPSSTRSNSARRSSHA